MDNSQCELVESRYIQAAESGDIAAITTEQFLSHHMHTLTHNIVIGFYQKIDTIFSLNQCVNDHKMNTFYDGFCMLCMSFCIQAS